MLISPNAAIILGVFLMSFFQKLYSGTNQAVAMAIAPTGLPKAGWAGRLHTVMAKTTYCHGTQRKAKALTGTTQRLCLDFCPVSVSRFRGTMACHSTWIQLASSHHVAWWCSCPTAQVPVNTKRRETPFTFTMSSQQHIQSCIRLHVWSNIATFTLSVILITLSSMSG